METWPSTLPQYPLAQSFQETPPDNKLRTETDKGPAKVRLRTTRGVRELSLSFRCSKAQTEILDNFYVSTLKFGTFSFTFTHPRTGVEKTLRIPTKPTYRADRRGLFYIVELPLEVLA